MLSPQPQERKGHRRGMKLGQGIEQPDGKTVTGIQICS